MDLNFVTVAASTNEMGFLVNRGNLFSANVAHLDYSVIAET